MPHELEKLVLRTATIQDLDVLQFWDTQQHVIDSDPDADWDWETELTKFPDWREQLMAEKEGEPLGFIQIIDPFREETHYWGTVGPNKRAIDIWIGEARNLGKGYGTRMMIMALERCFQDVSVKEVLIDPLESNTKAHRFYERIGFQFVERRTFETSDCRVYRLKREEWEVRIQKTGSMSR